jgi:hypothetical protein
VRAHFEGLDAVGYGRCWESPQLGEDGLVEHQLETN